MNSMLEILIVYSSTYRIWLSRFMISCSAYYNLPYQVNCQWNYVEFYAISVDVDSQIAKADVKAEETMVSWHDASNYITITLVKMNEGADVTDSLSWHFRYELWQNHSKMQQYTTIEISFHFIFDWKWILIFCILYLWCIFYVIFASSFVFRTLVNCIKYLLMKFWVLVSLELFMEVRFQHKKWIISFYSIRTSRLAMTSFVSDESINVRSLELLLNSGGQLAFGTSIENVCF